MANRSRSRNRKGGPGPLRRATVARRADPSPAAATSDVPDPTRLVLATLNVRMSTGTWTMKFTRAHPGVRLEILNRSSINGDFGVSDYWITGGLPGTWTREIQSYPDVKKVDALAEVGGGSLYRVSDRNPPVVHLYRKLGLPLQFPMRMQAGYIRWEVVSRQDEFRAILTYAREVDPRVEVVSIRNRPLRSHLPLLTETQQALLTRAMAEGYFAVPRGITLTELARRLNRSKSAISESIATIEKKLLESVMGPPRGSD
jgi:predicted DNA binding protein